MKKIKTSFTAIVSIVMFLSLTQTSCAMNSDGRAYMGNSAEGMINVESQFSVAETAKRLEKLFNKKGVTIFNRVKHSTAAEKIGVSLRPTELFIFGNPKLGSPLMKCQQTIAIDLPQKALIWQDENEQVWISYNDINYVAKRHNVKGCGPIIAKIGKVLGKLTQAAAQAKPKE